MNKEKLLQILDTFFQELSNSNSKDYLTEEDLRCRLFLEIENNKNNPDISISSEIRWFGINRRLKYRSDIVIMPYGSINEDLEMGSIFIEKGFTFEKYLGIIELKLRRSNVRKTDNKFLEEIEDDCKKLIKIKGETTNPPDSNTKLYSVFIVDKKANLVTEMNNLRQKYKFINIYYFSFLLTE